MYTHVLTKKSTMVRKLLSSVYQSNPMAVAVDEVHCIAQWLYCYNKHFFTLGDMKINSVENSRSEKTMPSWESFAALS